MTENETRQVLQKIKLINKKFISYYFAKQFNLDDDLPCDLNKAYINMIKDTIGGYINNVKSERILKALGFESLGNNTYNIPINCVELIKPGTKIKSLLDDEIVFNSINDINMDTRNGMLCYSITLKGIHK